MEPVDKSGKVKFTFEVEINQAAMDLAKQNIDMVTDLIAQNAGMWRENMMAWRREGMSGGHGMGAIMRHGQE